MSLSETAFHFTVDTTGVTDALERLSRVGEEHFGMENDENGPEVVWANEVSRQAALLRDLDNVLYRLREYKSYLNGLAPKIEKLIGTDLLSQEEDDALREALQGVIDARESLGEAIQVLVDGPRGTDDDTDDPETLVIGLPYSPVTLTFPFDDLTPAGKAWVWSLRGSDAFGARGLRANLPKSGS